MLDVNLAFSTWRQGSFTAWRQAVLYTWRQPPFLFLFDANWWIIWLNHVWIIRLTSADTIVPWRQVISRWYYELYCHLTSTCAHSCPFCILTNKHHMLRNITNWQKESNVSSYGVAGIIYCCFTVSLLILVWYTLFLLKVYAYQAYRTSSTSVYCVVSLLLCCCVHLCIVHCV